MDSDGYVTRVEGEGTDAADAIRDGLRVFNESKVGSIALQPLTVSVRDEEGELVGGATGGLFFDWLG